MKEFMIQLTYAVEWCMQYPKESKQCDSNHKHDEIILHGLWKIIENNCKSFTISQEEIIKILRTIPNSEEIAPEYFDEVNNIAVHEWNKHGICMNMTPEEYFQKAFYLVQEIKKNNYKGGEVITSKTGKPLYINFYYDSNFEKN